LVIIFLILLIVLNFLLLIFIFSTLVQTEKYYKHFIFLGYKEQYIKIVLLDNKTILIGQMLYEVLLFFGVSIVSFSGFISILCVFCMFSTYLFIYQFDYILIIENTGFYLMILIYIASRIDLIRNMFEKSLITFVETFNKICFFSILVFMSWYYFQECVEFLIGLLSTLILILHILPKLLISLRRIFFHILKFLRFMFGAFLVILNIYIALLCIQNILCFLLLDFIKINLVQNIWYFISHNLVLIFIFNLLCFSFFLSFLNEKLLVFQIEIMLGIFLFFLFLNYIFSVLFIIFKIWMLTFFGFKKFLFLFL
jgi:hypothetical protein